MRRAVSLVMLNAANIAKPVRSLLKGRQWITLSYYCADVNQAQWCSSKDTLPHLINDWLAFGMGGGAFSLDVLNAANFTKPVHTLLEGRQHITLSYCLNDNVVQWRMSKGTFPPLINDWPAIGVDGLSS